MTTDSRTAEVGKSWGNICYWKQKQKETRHMFRYEISYF